MSTNYYAKVHLGKMSGGPGGTKTWTWDASWLSIASLEEAIRRYEVEDEYGADIPDASLLKLIDRADQQRAETRAFS